MEEIISLQDVNYSYFGKIAALRNINMSVKKGEMFSVIGLNGSGKSTLLHIINGLVFPDSGKVCFHGNPITEENTDNSKSDFKTQKEYGLYLSES